MKERGIIALGTLRWNRVPGLKLLSENELKKTSRSTMDEYCATFDGSPKIINKLIHFHSTLTGDVASL